MEEAARPRGKCVPRVPGIELRPRPHLRRAHRGRVPGVRGHRQGRNEESCVTFSELRGERRVTAGWIMEEPCENALSDPGLRGLRSKGRHLEPGANWTFDKSEGPSDGLASKPHLAVGGRGRGNPQQLTESPGHAESKDQLSHPLGREPLTPESGFAGSPSPTSTATGGGLSASGSEHISGLRFSRQLAEVRGGLPELAVARCHSLGAET